MWANQNARTIFMSPLEHIYLKDLASPLYSKLQDVLQDIDENSDNQKVTYNANIYGKYII